MKLLDTIRNAASKVMATANNIGNAIDRDKSMPGMQLAQGGLGNAVGNFFGNARQSAKDRNQQIADNFADWQAQNRVKAYQTTVPQSVYDPTYAFGSGMVRGQTGNLGLENQIQKLTSAPVTYKPQTNLGKASYRAGQALGMATGAPAKISSGLVNLLKNTLVGSAIGGAMGAGGDIIHGETPTLESIGQGAIQGGETGYIFPKTSQLTNSALETGSKYIPQLAGLTDDALAELSKVGIKNILNVLGKNVAREVLETPLETGVMSIQDVNTPGNNQSYLNNYKNRFLGDVLGNAIFGAGKTGFQVGKANLFNKPGSTPEVPETKAPIVPETKIVEPEVIPPKPNEIDALLTESIPAQPLGAQYKGTNAVSIDDLLANRQKAEIEQQLDYLPKYEADLLKDIDTLTVQIKNYDLFAKRDPNFPTKKELELGLRETKKELSAVRKEISSIQNAKPIKNEATMLFSDKGVIPLRKPLSNTNQLDTILSRDYEVKPGDTSPVQQSGEQLLLTAGQPSPKVDDIFEPIPQANDEISALLKQQGKELGEIKSQIKNAKDPATKQTLLAEQKRLKREYAQTKKLQESGGTLSEENVNRAPYKKQGATKDYYQSVFSNIEKSGEAGKKIVDLYKQTNNTIEKRAGLLKSNLNEAFKKLSKSERNNFADYVEGRATSNNPAVAEAVSLWNQIGKSLRDVAVANGLDVGFIENYFPHKVNLDNLESQLIAKGVEPATARARANQFINRAKERKSSFLEFSREFPELDYSKNAETLYDYIDDVVRRIESTKNFGVDDSKLYDLADLTSDPNAVKNEIDRLLGKGIWGVPQAGSKASKIIRAVQTVIKLNPLTSFTNLTQNISTAQKTDIPSTLHALAQVITNPDAFYKKTIELGEIDPKTIRVFGENFEQSSLTGKYIKLIGMYGTERFNRVMAVAAGQNYGKKLLERAGRGSKSAIRELKRLGVDYKSEMSEKDLQPLLDNISKEVSKATQFSSPKGELPMKWDTPLGKVLTQFKSFAYQQTKFVSKETKRAISEAAKGNLKPLTNDLLVVGVAAPIVGEVVADIKSILTNKKRENMTLAERYIDNIKQGTSLGLIDNLESLKYGESGVIGLVGGPTASDAYKSVKAFSDAQAGLSNYDSDKSFLENIDPKNTTQRFLLGNIPVAGRTISNTVVDNAAIDNIFGGKNVGLTKDDKEIYNLLKQTSPDQAETFKQGNQYLDKKEEKSFISQLFSNEQKAPIIPSDTATPEERKEFNKNVEKILNEGLVPADDMLKAYVLRGKDPMSSSIKERKDAFEAIRSALNNEYYSDEQKQAIIKASGANENQVEFYTFASKTNDEKLQELLPSLGDLSTPENFKSLLTMRAKIAGQQGLTPGMIDYLYQNDYIGKDQRDLLKAIDFDEVTQKFFIKKSSKYGADGSSSKKLTYSQLLKLFSIDLKELNSSPTKSSDNYVLFKDPGLIENILNSKV
ncbi:MAG: hypothetical protein GX625_21650 [Clostridiaceae bacterium]|nr:hypothetical protein [Clostridiaceae bacterium]